MDTTSDPALAGPPAMRRGRPGLPSRRGSVANGFTLIEVMAAAAILAFVISGSIITMQSGFRALDTARKTTLAAQIMQSEMEQLRMQSWNRVRDLLTASEEIEIEDIFPQNTETERSILAEMERTFTATRKAAFVTGSGDEIIQVDISVTWNGIDGKPHKRTSSTRYCKDGLYNYYYTLNKSTT
jgi:prepilin-type N-terminal cleavage/methylation domain-containing protein